jgi:glutaconate CoA-transferase subunit A
MTELLTAEEAAARISPGATIGIGGLQGNHPVAMLHALARGGVTGLRVVGPTVGMAAEFLIAAGAVSLLAAPYMGAEGVIAVAPAYRGAVEAGTLELWECDEAILLAALRAAAQGLPYMPWRGGLDTDLPSLNPALTEYVDAPTGTRLLRVPAMPLDVALLRALEADEEGNVRYYRHSAFADPAFARAATRVFVEVERLVDHAAILTAPELTVLHHVDAVVVAPGGGHPFRAAGVHDQDDTWLRAWSTAVKAVLRAGGPLTDAPAVRAMLGL